jgi:hypothetical protein
MHGKEVRKCCGVNVTLLHVLDLSCMGTEYERLSENWKIYLEKHSLVKTHDD